jgi:hypothetical protein
VYCRRNNMPFVAIKMGRRQGGPSRTGGWRRIPPHFYTPVVSLTSEQHKSGAGRNRRATQPPAHFHRNPLGRVQLAVFPPCSLLTYRFRYARRYCQSGSDRLEKQPTDLRRMACYFGDSTLVDIDSKIHLHSLDEGHYIACSHRQRSLEFQGVSPATRTAGVNGKSG